VDLTDSASARIKLFCQQLDGWPGTVVAVTKHASLAQCQTAFDHGLTQFGENHVQNLLARQADLPHLPVQWHLIGPLQSNKVNKITGKVSLIQSVDSLALAQKISGAAGAGKQPVLLQVNWAAEPQKHGFDPQQLLSDVKPLIALPGLDVQGLMFIAPQGLEREVLQRLFSGLNAFKTRLEQQAEHRLPQLSMGMSQDFDIAMGCGATIIRVGSRLFA
jgi:PLP dependent protein